MLKNQILVVDDDPAIIAILEFTLTHAGYIVKVANNGFDALEILQSHKFSLILLDICMPHMNGLDFLERVRKMEEFKNLPIFMLTARSDHHAVKTAKEYGIIHYMVKPPNKEELLEKIKNEIGTVPQYRQFQVKEGSEFANAEIKFSLQVLSISEVGMVFRSDLAFKEGDVIRNIQTELFKQIGLNHPPLKVCGSVEDKDNKGRYINSVSFIEFGEKSILKIREFVVEKCLIQGAQRTA